MSYIKHQSFRETSVSALHAPVFVRALAFCRRQTAFRFVLAGLFPGTPFIAARILLHQHSGIVNLDYLVLTALAAFGFWTSASLLFVLTYALESVRLLDAVYFFSQQDVMFAAHFLADVPKWVVFAWLVAFVTATTIALNLWRSITPRVTREQLKPALLSLAMLVTVAATVDMTQGYNPFLVKPHGKPRPHLIGEVLVRMPLELRRSASSDQGSSVLAHSGTDPLWGPSVIRQKRENVVVVVVESMGLLTKRAGYLQEFEKLQSDPAVLNRYTVEGGKAPFTGATVPGELRELCHLHSTTHITEATLAGKPPCLPQQFRALGYETASFHGYRGTMFVRQNWYPQLGFEKNHFLADLNDVPKCSGAFYGTCDAAMASLLEQRLADKHKANGPPQFLYWMTLNSHLPVDVDRAPPELCPVAADREVCAQLAYVSVVLDSVKKLALDPDIGPTTIVIVGDHAPPYASIDRRDLFDDESVPYFVLLPKMAG